MIKKASSFSLVVNSKQLDVEILFSRRLSILAITSSVGNLRPTGRMRPAKAFYPARNLFSFSMMNMQQ